MADVTWEIPEVFKPFFTNARRKNYLFGGRGSGKSWTVAKYIVAMVRTKKMKVLCTRELQKTIKDSVLSLLRDVIVDSGLDSEFEIYKTYIQHRNGSQIIFAGVRQNVAEIKSMENISICWVEEAQSMSQESLDVLVPTIRAENSILIFTFNPFKDTDPVYVTAMNSYDDPDSLVIYANYDKNPFFPVVLNKERLRDQKNDPDRYAWVWEGKCKGVAAAQIFKGKYRTEAFETPANVSFFFGADWGFANDPTTLVRCFIVGNTLYVDRAIGKVRCELVDTPSLFTQVEGARFGMITCDSARPETISYMASKGWNCVSAQKTTIEDGIEYLRSFDEIVIHPDLKEVVEEFDFYQYKVDRQTGVVMRDVVDSYNHYIDALRYALLPHMRKANNGAVYAELNLQSFTPSVDTASVKELFCATITRPGIAVALLMAFTGSALVLADVKTYNEVVPLAKLAGEWARAFTWFPLVKPGEVFPELINECERCGIEVSVPYVVNTSEQGVSLVNTLLKEKNLKVNTKCYALVSAMTTRAFGKDGVLESKAQVNVNTLICDLVDYGVYRACGYLGVFGVD